MPRGIRLNRYFPVLELNLCHLLHFFIYLVEVNVYVCKYIGVSHVFFNFFLCNSINKLALPIRNLNSKTSFYKENPLYSNSSEKEEQTA